MLQSLPDPHTADCSHSVMRQARWMPNGKGWICADDEHPECHFRIEVSSERCEEAKYWEGRFEGMRRTYQERFNEGLTMAAWHEKHCAAMRGAKDMQMQIALLIADLDKHPHFISAADVSRRLKPLLPKGPETPPACSHD